MALNRRKTYQKIVFGVLIALFLAILFFFHLKGIIYYDEGYILNSALRITQGQVPYRDFDVVYTPLSFVITSGFLSIFGESIFAGRIAAFTISVLSLFALFKILGLLTKDKVLIVLAMLFFISWGPTHMNFPWPTMFAICFFFYALWFFLLGINQKKRVYFYLAGIMTVLVFLSKQNFGTGVLVTLSLSLLFLSIDKKKMLLSYFFGLISASSIFLFILFITSSLIPFLDNVYLYTLKRIMLEKTLDTPFLYEGSLLSKIAKLFFYT